MNKKVFILLCGDTLTVAILTAIGFASHNALGSAPALRLAATFFPTLVAWLLIAPWLGLYDPQITEKANQLWRPVWAIVLAGPMAAFLRSLMLDALPIIPIFVLVLIGTSALGMLIWRFAYWLWARHHP